RRWCWRLRWRGWRWGPCRVIPLGVILQTWSSRERAAPARAHAQSGARTRAVATCDATGLPARARALFAFCLEARPFYQTTVLSSGVSRRGWEDSWCHGRYPPTPVTHAPVLAGGRGTSYGPAARTRRGGSRGRSPPTSAPRTPPAPRTARPADAS